MEAVEGHDEREREMGFEQGSCSSLLHCSIPEFCIVGYQDGFVDGEFDGGW